MERKGQMLERNRMTAFAIQACIFIVVGDDRLGDSRGFGEQRLPQYDSGVFLEFHF